MTDSQDIKRALKTDRYKDLFVLATTQATETVTAPQKAIMKVGDSTEAKPSTPGQDQISPETKPLAHNIASIIDRPYKQRGERLKMSMRLLASARRELVEKGLAKEVWLGKSLYLAGTDKLYQCLGILSPYKRNVSLEHSFLVLLTQSLIEVNPLIRKTGIEIPVGTAGCTNDLVAYLINGDRWAYEITLSSSNVTENAAKMRNRGFAKIVFVCRDDSLRKSVRKILLDADFDPDFSSTIECTIFSTLISQSKRFKAKGTV
jgi:hypothetical protein